MRASKQEYQYYGQTFSAAASTVLQRHVQLHDPEITALIVLYVGRQLVHAKHARHKSLDACHAELLSAVEQWTIT